MNKITVRVPATTANMGPGFDCFGCALSMSNIITVSHSERTVISGCDEKYCDKNNLAYRAAAAVYRSCGLPELELNIEIKAEIPLARGLGSSAAMLAGGAVAANALCGNLLDKNEILKLLNKIEGHPDNLAPALFGGLTAALASENKIFVEKYQVHSSIHFCAFIPSFEISTHKARKVLPENIRFSDSASQISRAVMLLRGLEKGDSELISSSVKDVLHEPYRKNLINGFDDLKKKALDSGAIAFFISGSGPTCIALTYDPEFDKNFSMLRDFKPIMLKPDTTGTVIIKEE